MNSSSDPSAKRLHPLYVTRPSLPPIDDFMAYVRKCWESGFFTSGPKGAPLANELEQRLSRFLDAPSCVLMGNGTVVLELLLEAMALRGEVITTPFTYLATSGSLFWRGCKPVFADIDPETFNMDPSAIRRCLSDRTVAILPVHVFGQPCAIDEIQAIARDARVPVLYDAAHCFGSRYRGASVLGFGDASTLSFQATKIFQTGEGGAVFTRSEGLADRLRRMRIFGLDRDGRIVDPGTNAKMSELNAAMGLALLDHMPAVLADRKVSYLDYRERLTGLPGIRFQRVDESETNFSYFPVVFEREADRTRVLEVLRSQNIHPRIYFDTSLDQVDYLADGRECPNSRLLTRKILCLPLFNGMPGEDRARTCDLIRSALD